MKKRKKLRKKHLRHEKLIQISIFVILFIAGYLVSWIFLSKPLNNSQLELCEQVARDVYTQKGNAVVETLDNFSVSMTTTAITVQSANLLNRGKVIAKKQNGELVITQDMETGKAVFISILMGIEFVLVPDLIFSCAYAISKKIREFEKIKDFQKIRKLSGK